MYGTAHSTQCRTCLEGETAWCDVHVVLGHRRRFLRNTVWTDAEEEEYALSVLQHVYQLIQTDLLLLIGLTSGEDDLTQLGRETLLLRISELHETTFLCKVHEVSSMVPDGCRTGDPFRHLDRGTFVLGEGETEQRKVHVECAAQITRACENPAVRFPEILIVRIVQSDGDPSPTHDNQIRYGHCCIQPTCPYPMAGLRLWMSVRERGIPVDPLTAHDRIGIPIHEDLLIGIIGLETCYLTHDLGQREVTGTDVDEDTVGFHRIPSLEIVGEIMVP